MDDIHYQDVDSRLFPVLVAVVLLWQEAVWFCPGPQVMGQQTLRIDLCDICGRIFPTGRCFSDHVRKHK